MEILDSGATYVISLINERTFTTVYYKHNTTMYNHDVSKSTAFFLWRTNSLLDKIGT
jgi:hypothetical protein